MWRASRVTSLPLTQSLHPQPRAIHTPGSWSGRAACYNRDCIRSSTTCRRRLDGSAWRSTCLLIGMQRQTMSAPSLRVSGAGMSNIRVVRNGILYNYSMQVDVHKYGLRFAILCQNKNSQRTNVSQYTIYTCTKIHPYIQYLKPSFTFSHNPTYMSFAVLEGCGGCIFWM